MSSEPEKLIETVTSSYASARSIITKLSKLFSFTTFKIKRGKPEEKKDDAKKEDAKKDETKKAGDTDKAVLAMIDHAVDTMYSTDDENKFLEVTYQNGDKEVMYFKDFSSGAMIENIVRRAKKLAIKRQIAGEGKGIRAMDLLESTTQVFTPMAGHRPDETGWHLRLR